MENRTKSLYFLQSPTHCSPSSPSCTLPATRRACCSQRDPRTFIMWVNWDLYKYMYTFLTTFSCFLIVLRYLFSERILKCYFSTEFFCFWGSMLIRRIILIWRMNTRYKFDTVVVRPTLRSRGCLAHSPLHLWVPQQQLWTLAEIERGSYCLAYSIQWILHDLIVIVTFLRIPQNNSLSFQIFCKLLVTEMHYLNCIIIFLYVVSPLAQFDTISQKSAGIQMHNNCSGRSSTSSSKRTNSTRTRSPSSSSRSCSFWRW